MRTKPQKKTATGDQVKIAVAIKVLTDGLKYHEYDGHNMPKRVAREALEVLGVPESEQP